MSTARVLDEQRCAVRSAATDEQLAGTAPVARAWIALEQTGPWGAKALTQSHLDPRVGKALKRLVDDHPVRVLLTRRPGRHADTEGSGPRTVWLASTVPGRVELRRWLVEHPAELLDLDVAAMAAGELPDVGQVDPEPLLLVCTNARRDRCCALEGRPAALTAAAAEPGRVWECSHLGGHRFAPTALLLPHGYVLGRLAPDDAVAVLDRTRTGQLDLDGLRGRSTWSEPAQAAELAVRRAHGLTGLTDVDDAVASKADDATWDAVVHGRGRDHLVRVLRRSGPPRPESCGKDPAPGRSHDTVLLGTRVRFGA